MRRVLVPMVVSVGLVATVFGSVPVNAVGPAELPAVAVATAGKKVCVIDDDRLVELSGLVATPTGYIVINDSSEVESRERVFFLNKKCAVKNDVSYGSEPRDPEDMALSPDRKTLWIGDIGDLDGNRKTIGLWKMPADGSDSPVLYRLSYPDGSKDAEALLIDKDGVPLIITKGPKTLVYKPATALKKSGTTPLQKVGEVTLPKTTTENPLGLAGRITVTGAAAAPDGSRVVLRTYADAFEWDVTDGDIFAAFTKGTPRITPLPNEPWGESITYSVDGATFLTVSETVQQQEAGADAVILRYAPVKVAPKSAATDANGAKDDRSFFEKLDLGDITAFLSVIGVVGLLLVGAGVLGIVSARRRAAETAEDDQDKDDADDTDDADRREGEPVRAAARVAGGPPGVGEDAALGPDSTGSVGHGRGGAVYGAARVSPGTYQVDRADSGAVGGVDRAPSGDVRRVDRAPSGDVRRVDRAPSGDVRGVDRAPSGAVYGAARVNPGTYQVDRADSGAVRGVDRAPSGDVRRVDRAPSGDVRGVDRAPSGDVRGVDRAPSGAVYGGAADRSGAVYGVDRGHSGAVRGVDRAPSGAIYGDGYPGGQPQDPRGRVPRGSRGRGVPQRGSEPPVAGGRGAGQRGGRRPDGARARTGDEYYGGDYPQQDGYVEQPPAGVRRPANDQEYGDRGQEYEERGGY